MSGSKRWALMLAAAFGIVAGCAAPGPQITTDFDSAVDFSQYRTYAFMSRDERGGVLPYDSIADRRIMAAAAREMEARGYRRVEWDADLLVNFAVTTETVEDVMSVPSAVVPPPWYRWRTGYYYHPWPAYTYETRVDRYERGTVFIDLVDSRRNQLVWEGRAVERVTRETRADPAGALDRTVSEIFARYPYMAAPDVR